MSAKTEAGKKVLGGFTNMLGSLWRGRAGNAAKQARQDFKSTPNEWQFAAGNVKPTMTNIGGNFSKITDPLWNNRSGWQKTLGLTAALPALPLIPKAIGSIASGYTDILKNAYGFGDGSSSQPAFDVSQIKTPEQQYIDSTKGLYDIYDSMAEQPDELLAITQMMSPKTNPGAVGGNVQSGFTKQQLAAQESAAGGGGTSTGTSTPVAGNLSATLDSFGTAGKYAQDKMNQYQAAANAAGVKLGNDWRQKYMMGLVADASARQQAADRMKLEQQLTDAGVISAMRQKGVVLPDVSKLNSKAIEYNNLDDNSKKYLAARGIRSAADYVNNYVNTIQG